MMNIANRTFLTNRRPEYRPTLPINNRLKWKQKCRRIHSFLCGRERYRKRDEYRKHNTFYPTYGLSNLFTKLAENLLQRKMVKLIAENMLQRKSVKLTGNVLQRNCLSPIVFVLVWL